LSGKGANLGGRGCDTFLLEASLLDSLRFSAMFTIWVESRSSDAMLDRCDASGEEGELVSAFEFRFVNVIPLVTSDDFSDRLDDGSGVEVSLPLEGSPL
jgi:hypothetical protein